VNLSPPSRGYSQIGLPCKNIFVSVYFLGCVD